ncbi:MAG: SRPBCC family protein [Candidatus Promineifilaceae bacterium]|nr:SRPBCC family protein [Candidatus Promineifilaceae bacterium]
MAHFTTEITIEAPLDEVWQVLADIGTIARWNPGVIASRATSETTTGLGAKRFCDLGGDNYLKEQVVEYRERRKLTMRVTETNLPFATADIHFSLREEDGRTLVVCAPDYALKYGPLGTLMDRLYVRKTYEEGMRRLLRGLKDDVEQADRPVTAAAPAEQAAALSAGA